ncbi:hypothetical protein ACS0TY_026027 [Phlomoides rotata]
MASVLVTVLNCASLTGLKRESYGHSCGCYCLIEHDKEKKICLAGDFNAVRFSNEMVGKNGSGNSKEMEIFDKFIGDSNLVDLPMIGRSFTWYRPDGSCKNRLGRIVVNEEWLVNNSNVHLKGIPRSVSDHYCPLILVIV